MPCPYYGVVDNGFGFAELAGGSWMVACSYGGGEPIGGDLLRALELARLGEPGSL